MNDAPIGTTRPQPFGPTSISAAGGALRRARDPRIRRMLGAVAALTLLMALPVDVWAQAAAPSAGAREMRHFWHVFIAFALAWILVFGWVAMIVRRLRRVEDSLE